MKLRHEITEEEFQVIIKAIEKTLGYWGKKSLIECCDQSKHCTGMSVETFIKSLRNEFIIK